VCPAPTVQGAAFGLWLLQILRFEPDTRERGDGHTGRQLARVLVPSALPGAVTLAYLLGERSPRVDDRPRGEWDNWQASKKGEGIAAPCIGLYSPRSQTRMSPISIPVSSANPFNYLRFLT